MQRSYGLEIPETLEEVCRPQRLALLVYDMQVGIVRHVPDTQRLSPGSRGCLQQPAGLASGSSSPATCRCQGNWPVSSSSARPWPGQRVQRVEDVRPLFLPDSPEVQLPELTPLPSETVFDKLAMSMFVGTPLELVLRDCGVNAFAIVGAVTEIGIEPTVRHGADLGFIPVIVADAARSMQRPANAVWPASTTPRCRCRPMSTRCPAAGAGFIAPRVGNTATAAGEVIGASA